MDDRRDLLTPEERQKLKQNSMIKGYERKKRKKAGVSKKGKKSVWTVEGGRPESKRSKF